MKLVYPNQEAIIASLKVEEVIISTKYSNFPDIFFLTL